MKDLHEDKIIGSMRERLGRYEEAPSEEVWAKIAAGQKNERGAVWPLVVGGMAVVGVLLIGVFVYDGTSNISSTVIASEEKSEALSSGTTRSVEQNTNAVAKTDPAAADDNENASIKGGMTDREIMNHEHQIINTEVATDSINREPRTSHLEPRTQNPAPRTSHLPSTVIASEEKSDTPSSGSTRSVEQSTEEIMNHEHQIINTEVVTDSVNPELRTQNPARRTSHLPSTVIASEEKSDTPSSGSTRSVATSTNDVATREPIINTEHPTSNTEVVTDSVNLEPRTPNLAPPSVTPPYKKPKNKFQLYFAFNPSLSFQKIIPTSNDDVIVDGFQHRSPLSMKRFGFGIDAGIQKDINKYFGYYGGLSFYHQQQQLTYSYFNKDATVTRVGDEWIFDVTREAHTKTIDYTMTNVGARAGMLVTLKGDKLKHKFGAGLSFSQGLAKSSDSYNNIRSSYLAYQVFYRNEVTINEWWSWYIEPNFTYSFVSKEKLAEPFSLKPYRAGISFGVLYRF